MSFSVRVCLKIHTNDIDNENKTLVSLWTWGLGELVSVCVYVCFVFWGYTLTAVDNISLEKKEKRDEEREQRKQSFIYT